MSDVPDELLLLALVESVNDGREELADFSADDIETYREILAAVIPAIRADERAKVADELYERAMGCAEGTGFRRHLLAASRIINPPTIEDAARALREGNYAWCPAPEDRAGGEGE